MKKYIYILLTFCLLISCMEDPTAGVVVPNILRLPRIREVRVKNRVMG